MAPVAGSASGHVQAATAGGMAAAVHVAEGAAASLGTTANAVFASLRMPSQPSWAALDAQSQVQLAVVQQWMVKAAYKLH